MTDIVRIRDKYYVRATSALADARVCILKCGSTIAVLNRFGGIEGAGFGQTGVYHQETRHLSRFALQINGMRPLLLNCVVHEDNSYLSVDLANPEISLKSGGSLPPETVHFYRAKFVQNDTLYDELRIDNYGTEAVRLQVAVIFEADFADIFEIRGTKREKHGTRLDDVVGRAHAVLSYRGLDDIVRRTILRFSPVPDFMSGRQARFDLELQPKQETFLQISASCEQGPPRRVVDEPGPTPGERVFAHLRESLGAGRGNECCVRSPNMDYDAWFERSRNDLHLLTVGNVEGRYPYAGVPWFNTVFGRDGIITALELLWMAPDVARDVLIYLASSQAKTEDPERDSQPGKILHEFRRGEMANTHEVPFGRYYGSVDATPLFVLLAGAYLIRTADLNLIRDLWPNIEAALEWTVRYGDPDGDGFVEYNRRSKTGLVQQGWKDSSDSIFHKDGREAKPPIALAEVQAYVYAARRMGARMAGELGKLARAEELERSAEQMRARFEASFWDEGLGMYALALDGDKEPCRVRTSNAGQTLFCRIADAQRAARVRDSLMSGPMFTGWGIRTVSAEEVRYNPMSYHNGSVWPHDNALIALGFAAYGFEEDAARLLGGIKEASGYFDLRRLPELYCGFHKRTDSTGPTKYPVACSPQAWSAGASLLLLQASLGMTVLARECRIDFVNPHLPHDLNELVIENLRLGDGVADIAVRRRNGIVAVEAIRKEGRLEIRATPA